METKLYNRLFVRLEELGAIRKTPVLVFAGLEPSREEFTKEHPVLTDCLNFNRKKVKNWQYINPEDFTELWDLSEPYLKDQSDELGVKILDLLS